MGRSTGDSQPENTKGEFRMRNSPSSYRLSVTSKAGAGSCAPVVIRATSALPKSIRINVIEPARSDARPSDIITALILIVERNALF